MQEESRPWRWRNCRTLEIAFVLSALPWQWRVQGAWDADYMSVNGFLQLGPVGFTIYADIGNCSDETWRGRFGLSEEKAWERSK